MLTEIESVTNRMHMDRQVRRRDRVMARIREIDAQLTELERNALLRDEIVDPQRRHLLTYLSTFHHTEIDQMDGALNRLATSKYGLCLGCNNRIEADWLESFPEADFCSACHRIRANMKAG